MTATERNALLRDLANEVAAQVAPAIGLANPPKCHRVTRRRGHGSERGFSVPLWAAADQHYFNYYAAHEVCHALDYSHGPKFKAAEESALRALGMIPVYTNAGRGPYVEALTDLSGFPLVVRIGKANPTRPPGIFPGI